MWRGGLKPSGRARPLGFDMNKLGLAPGVDVASVGAASGSPPSGFPPGNPPATEAVSRGTRRHAERKEERKNFALFVCLALRKSAAFVFVQGGKPAPIGGSHPSGRFSKQFGAGLPNLNESSQVKRAFFQRISKCAWWTLVIARRSKTPLVSGKFRDSPCAKFHFFQ